MLTTVCETAVPQNTGGNEHYCGRCSLGCAAAEKQGPIISWLPDAAKSGATFAEGFKVERVLFEDINGQKTAVGVKGIWTSRNTNGGVDGPLSDQTQREVIIRAKKVVISCGALWSPIILLNSGLTVSLDMVIYLFHFLLDSSSFNNIRLNTKILADCFIRTGILDAISTYIPSTLLEAFGMKI